MRRTTVPPETFFQSSPISSRTRCHDDPSGARVPILMPGGQADAATRKEKGKKRPAPPPAPLSQKEFIHPPHQPSRLALRQEIGKAELRGLPPRVEGKRPGKKAQELLPVLRAHGDRLGERHQGGNLPPASEFHRALEVAFRLVQGSPHPSRPPRPPLRAGGKPFPEAGMCGLETPHAILLRPQEEALRPVRAGVRPLPVPFLQRILQDERRSVLREPPAQGGEQTAVGRLLRENILLHLERERSCLPHKIRVVVGAYDLPPGRQDIRPPVYDIGPGGTTPGRPQKEEGDHRRERPEPISRWMPPRGVRFPSLRLPSGPVPGDGTVSGETPKITS